MSDFHSTNSGSSNHSGFDVAIHPPLHFGSEFYEHFGATRGLGIVAEFFVEKEQFIGTGVGRRANDVHIVEHQPGAGFESAAKGVCGNIAPHPTDVVHEELTAAVHIVPAISADNSVYNTHFVGGSGARGHIRRHDVESCIDSCKIVVAGGGFALGDSRRLLGVEHGVLPEFHSIFHIGVVFEIHGEEESAHCLAGRSGVEESGISCSRTCFHMAKGVNCVFYIANCDCLRSKCACRENPCKTHYRN